MNDVNFSTVCERELVKHASDTFYLQQLYKAFTKPSRIAAFVKQFFLKNER